MCLEEHEEKVGGVDILCRADEDEVPCGRNRCKVRMC